MSASLHFNRFQVRHMGRIIAVTATTGYVQKTDSNPYTQMKNYTRTKTAWKQLMKTIKNYKDFFEYYVPTTVMSFNKAMRAQNV